MYKLKINKVYYKSTSKHKKKLGRCGVKELNNAADVKLPKIARWEGDTRANAWTTNQPHLLSIISVIFLLQRIIRNLSIRTKKKNFDAFKYNAKIFFIAFYTRSNFADNFWRSITVQIIILNLKKFPHF